MQQLTILSEKNDKDYMWHNTFFITNMLFAQLYLKVGILLTCGKHYHDHIISLRDEVLDYKTSLTQPLFIEVPVPNQENEWLCICVLRV